jgi:MoaA/NifB/PqqE/SkfB family radical SAM enzyme
MRNNLAQHWADQMNRYANDRTFINATERAEITSGPMQIAIDITNRCMMRCKHCFNRSHTVKRDEMSDRRLQEAFKEIASIKPQQVCICGGEPLIRLESVIKGTRLLLDTGILVAMVSNGYLIDEEVADALAETGFKQLQISLDGFRESHERLRGLPGAFERAVKAIERLVARGIKVNTSFTPTRFNVSEFPEFADFAKSLGVSELRVQPLMLMGETFFNRDLFPTDDQYHELVRFISGQNYKRIRSSEISDFMMSWGDPVDHMIRFSKYNTKPTYSFQISSSGKIMVSPYIPIFVGDINRHSLTQYWEAGLDKIWETNFYGNRVKRICGIESLGTSLPPIYFNNHVEVDLVDDSSAEIEETMSAHFASATA